MKNKKILISGGGIAGCTLAYFLKQTGSNVTIVESAPEFKHIGYLLALNKQIGQKVAEKMGILDKLKQFEVLLTRNIIFDMYGKLILDFDAPPELHNENTGLMLNRADLHATLHDLVKNDVAFRFDQELSAITQENEGVDVVFKDGTKERFDLVIGADGIHSKTRELAFGSGFEKYLGTAYFAFIVPNRTGGGVAGERDLVMMRGKEFLLAYHATSSGIGIGGYIFHAAKTFDALPAEARRSYMLEKYGKFDPKFRHILESLAPEDAIFHGPFTQIVMPEWYKGRVCLIGDAAHSPTPASGLGASMAMADAYILAKKLSECVDYRDAFTAYDAHVRPYIGKAQKRAITAAKILTGTSRVPYELTNAVLRRVPASFITKVHSHKLEMPLP